MSLMRKSGSVVAAIGVVFGLVFIVQDYGVGTPREVRKANQPAASAVRSVMMSKSSAGEAVFGMPATGSQPLPEISTDENIAAIDSVLGEVSSPRAEFVQSSPMDGCVTSLQAQANPAAMVSLSITSPCHPNDGFVVWHDRLAFSLVTDGTGAASVNVPALHEESEFVVTLENLEEARVSVFVEDANDYDRAILQWRGEHNLQLHALERGATYGDPGHIWSASTQSAALAVEGERGFMMRLGSSKASLPYWAEVYTYPAQLTGRDGQVALHVGAVVTQANCGRSVDAVALQTNASQFFVSRDLVVAMLDCSSVGESVMYGNLFDPLRLAKG
ncbi:hypothetical protein [Yoonia sediminilitoris]|uniref:Uncharacterized protein n=1 Tax=Yoonia sediminilitoris TaxID=1286148 RepID=A0A2T6KLN1_9RHOB|nr:hypothetical protein [Yoonia sediminilitoris]PUB17125.1 hypothetical protein C8N45_102135 [Yoonia sediminilitoris]RCW97420.1 hypothetical protein DFP92_102135 [Yoonia sediminilitoris]